MMETSLLGRFWMDMRSAIKSFFYKRGYDVRRIDSQYSAVENYVRHYGRSDVEKRRFYNIGAGSFFHPAWTNVDYVSEWYGENTEKTLSGINYNLLSMKPIPVESGTAHAVYSSHTVEHITNGAAQNMFNEAYRMLKDGGVLRVTTPDIKLYLRAYHENDRDFFYWVEKPGSTPHSPKAMSSIPLCDASIHQLFLWQFATSASVLHRDGAPQRIDDEDMKRLFTGEDDDKALDACISRCPLDIQRKYPGNHINWWSYDKMRAMMASAGFGEVCRSGYAQSRSWAMRDTELFDNTHPPISLYVEAVK
jgi:hypothetical protein